MWIHIARLDVTEQFQANPQVVPILVVVAVAALAAFAWWLRGQPRDWQLTTRVDAHLPSVEVVGPARVLPLRNRTLLASIGEETPLVSLVVVVFAQVLPDVRATTVQIVASTLALIAANAAVSQFLARYGTTWQSTLSQFAAMAGVNVGITVALWLLPGRSGASFNPASSLLSLLLLTLLVTFYDRYRTVRRERTERLGRSLRQPALGSQGP